jgi:DNA-binding IscR family transcriptional regulator
VIDAVVPIEGGTSVFECAEIRQRGIGGAGRRFAEPCGVTMAMRRAELAWRRELAAQTIADLLEASPASAAAHVRSEFARATG